MGLYQANNLLHSKRKHLLKQKNLCQGKIYVDFTFNRELISTKALTTQEKENNPVKKMGKRGIQHFLKDNLQTHMGKQTKNTSASFTVREI